MMSYERLDVYQYSIQFLALSIAVLEDIPRGNSGLADQIKRASISVPLNIAEGAGKRTKADCRKYFDTARGSAMECAAGIDVCKLLGLVDEEKAMKMKELLHRIVAMLSKLARV